MSKLKDLIVVEECDDLARIYLLRYMPVPSPSMVQASQQVPPAQKGRC